MMAREKKSILQTKFFYVGSIFAVSFGTVSFLWRYKSVNWLLIAFGIAWVFVVTAFAWEIVTRAERLDELVKSRTHALNLSNTHLSALLEQISAFHQISHDINQKLEVREVAQTFVDRLQAAFAELHSVWLWLEERYLHETGGEDGEEPAKPRLVLAAVAGDDMGRPAEKPGSYCRLVMEPTRTGAPTVAQELGDEAARAEWKWLSTTAISGFVGYPLRLGRTTLGVLGIFTNSPMTSEFLKHLYLSINQLAVTIENARLLSETRNRARELAEANTELRRLDTVKNWFVSAVSHELKTPLTSIRSFSEILENHEALTPQQRKEFAAIIKNESERLAILINDTLDAAAVADGEFEWKPAAASPETIVERSCKLFMHSAENKRVELRRETPAGLPLVWADEGKAITVLNNLIGNAVKFTRPGDEIRVCAALIAEDDGRRFIRISVSDTGPGIPEKDQQRIFQKFVQLGEPPSDHPRGAGLGLAICKQIVERHGGKIGVESKPGEGSTFFFTLPLCDGEGPPSAQNTATQET